ncbi:MAG TPA: DNA recombination protein RmuC [candidate division WWE3 bacterium]|uniref:DNA recombination protein RmuC n=1 Tax=candidate division WWE3 bacterium TaxID=2053526 RepID=A0A7C1NSV9_UNCKA|nr:DNA recombination protein RmuC [candidate division WWE3 bacterium]
MDILSLLTLTVLLVVIGVVIYLLQKVGQLSSLLKGEEILQRLEQHKGELGANLRSLDERLHTVTRDIGGVKEVTTSLQEFQASLKSQKIRGNVGEMILEDLLHQVFPSSGYESQFTFKNGKRADAVIKTRQGFIPVDSKFPIEDFQKFSQAEDEGERSSLWKAFVRNVKQKMDETAQYILPEEGTVPFVLMYIPYEPIFQEVVSDSELMRYTLEKSVFFTSPQTFLVTIQSILLGLQREHFAEQADEILKTLYSVSKDAGEFDTLLRRSAAQLAGAKNNMDKLLGVFASLLAKLEQLKDLDSKPKKLRNGASKRSKRIKS